MSISSKVLKYDANGVPELVEWSFTHADGSHAHRCMLHPNKFGPKQWADLFAKGARLLTDGNGDKDTSKAKRVQNYKDTEERWLKGDRGTRAASGDEILTFCQDAIFKGTGNAGEKRAVKMAFLPTLEAVETYMDANETKPGSYDRLHKRAKAAAKDKDTPLF